MITILTVQMRKLIRRGQVTAGGCNQWEVVEPGCKLTSFTSSPMSIMPTTTTKK